MFIQLLIALLVVLASVALMAFVGKLLAESINAGQ